jgi:hypothetical protein
VKRNKPKLRRDMRQLTTVVKLLLVGKLCRRPWSSRPSTFVAAVQMWLCAPYNTQTVSWQVRLIRLLAESNQVVTLLLQVRSLPARSSSRPVQPFPWQALQWRHVVTTVALGRHM